MCVLCVCVVCACVSVHVCVCCVCVHVCACVCVCVCVGVCVCVCVLCVCVCMCACMQAVIQVVACQIMQLLVCILLSVTQSYTGLVLKPVSCKALNSTVMMHNEI